MGKLLHNRVNRRELKERLRQSDERRVTLSYYKYVQLPDPAAFRDDLYLAYKKLGVLGRIYVAAEGVNAQLSVPEQNFEAFKTAMDGWDFFRNLRLNIAVEDDGKSFFALIIKVREKIVADGIDDPAFQSFGRPALHGVVAGHVPAGSTADRQDDGGGKAEAQHLPRAGMASHRGPADRIGEGQALQVFPLRP